MEHSSVTKKPDAHTRAFRLGNARAKFRKKRLNIRPADIPADWALKKQVQRFAVLALHRITISLNDVMSRRKICQCGEPARAHGFDNTLF
jgi:hypothetical protein